MHDIAARVAETAAAHPIVTTFGGIASAFVAVLQSSQELVGTLVAFVTSLAGLVTVCITLRNVWRNRNKPKD